MRATPLLTLLGLLLCLLPIHGQAQDYDDLIQQALAARNGGDFQTAEQLLRQAQPLAADQSEVNYLLGMVLAFQERFREGLDVIEAGLAQAPDNIELRLARARVLFFQGLLRQAQDQVDEVLDQHPEHLEALNLAGRLAYQQRQFDRAQHYYQQVLDSSPDDLEALIGLYDLDLARGQSSQADTWLDRASRVSPEHIDVLSRQQPGQHLPVRSKLLTLGFDRSNFDRPGFDRWLDRFVEYRRLQANGNQQYLRAEYNQRFGDYNSQIEAGALLRQNTRLPLELAAAFSPDNSFLPQYRLHAGTRLALKQASQRSGALILTPSLHHAHFVNGQVQRLHLGMEYYLLSTNAWITPGAGLVRDQDGRQTLGWNLGAHWQATASARAGVNYSSAPETENTLTIDTRVFSAYLQYRFSPTYQINLHYTRNQRQGSYTRDSINVALQLRF